MRIGLHDILANAATSRAEAPALTFKDSTLIYKELWQHVVGFAAGLDRIGVKRGDRVAVYLDKSVEAVVAIFGISAAGGVFVPINPLLLAKQVSYIIADCGIRVLITSVERFELLRDQLNRNTSVENVVIVGAVPATSPESRYTISTWTSFRVDSAVLPDRKLIDVDMAAIFYTSGSTGKPKGVVLTHRNLVAGAESVSSYLRNNAADVILAVLPLSFDAGFSQLTTGFAVGAHVVLMNYLLPGQVVQLCAKHGITGLTCVPPLWLQLADQAWPADATQRVRYIANTGGRMPKPTLEKLRNIFPNATPYLMYGLTEAFRSTYLDPAEIDRRPGSIGKAIPNAEVLVVRPDGSLADPGEEGELVHRGALVAMGYWNDPERTAERFRPAPHTDGAPPTEIAVWSGDFVLRDEEGFLYFLGRRDEMIKTSGYRLSPTEIEDAAYDTGLVREAVALGVADERIGQRIVLVASPVDERGFNEAILLEDLKKQLPRYMVPHLVLLRRSLPRSPNGKFDRNRLREEVSR
jgi:acyl-CoA ligase (AMP-forming) (exosortase A-associated)